MQDATAWHYTTGEKFALIRSFGVLLPASIGVRPPERPIVWFSLRQDFEPTARKALADHTGAIVRFLEVEEMRDELLGVYRLGAMANRLLAGEALRRAARMPPKVWRALQAQGVKQGADPVLWRGAVCDAIPLVELRFECMDAAGKWVPLA